jgi:hypothetical protein
METVVAVAADEVWIRAGEEDGFARGESVRSWTGERTWWLV